MAEPKRLEFTTITPTQKPKQKVAYPTAERFKLSLKESTETTCPEFSYTDLVKNAVLERKKRDTADVEPDPFGDDKDDEKLEAIAKAFEDKYGPKVKTKKGRPSDRVRDLVDLGDGYDDTDAFIDNSEAYDEIVPRCLTTKLGGFYINSGVLDFRYASEDSGDDFQKTSKVVPVKKKRKMRTIESDSDSNTPVNTEVKQQNTKKRKLKEGLDGEKKRKKKLLIGPDGEKIVVKRGRKPLDKNKLKKKMSPTVSELLKQQTASTSTPTHAVNGNRDTSMTDESYLPYDHGNIGSTIELLLKDDSESREGDDDKRPETVIPMPAGLPDRLQQTISMIKQAAKESREGKCKFFSGNVNKLLLDIEMQSRQLRCGYRTTIYAHLSCYLPCGKETLLKRAKKLRQSQQDDLFRDPINKLKEAVNELMPVLLEKYDAESQMAAIMRQENKEKVDGDGKDAKEEGSTESDDETADGDKKKRIMGPRKKFEWTDRVRSLLLDVVRVKMKMFIVRQKGQTAEEFIRYFLDTEIRTIWPSGWMQTRMLYKESRSVHGPWTNVQKPRKLLQGPTKTASPTPMSQKNNNIIEIFDSVETDNVKEGSGSDLETGSLRLEDYMNISDVDNMLKEINRTDPQAAAAIPALLDYTEKSSTGDVTSTTATTTTAATTTAAAAVVRVVSSGDKKPQLKQHSSSQGAATVALKVKDVTKHGLVTEMLKSPLPAAQSLLSPQPEAGPRKTTFFSEFEKHLMASKEELPPKAQVSAADQQATSKLQAMMAQAQASSNQQQQQAKGSFATPKLSPTQHEALREMQKKAIASVQGHRQSLGVSVDSKSLPCPAGLKLTSTSSLSTQHSQQNVSQQHRLSLSPGQKQQHPQQQPPKLQQHHQQPSKQPQHHQQQPSKQQQHHQQQQQPPQQPPKQPPKQHQQQQQQQPPKQQQHHHQQPQPPKTQPVNPPHHSKAHIGPVQNQAVFRKSQQKVATSSPKVSSSTIDKEAVQQLRHQLMQLANAQYGNVSSSQGSKSAGSKTGQDSLMGQLFKEPLPANMAAQRQAQQTAKVAVSSALKIDTQNSAAVPAPRLSPGDPLRMSPQGQRSGVKPKQPGSVHVSGGSVRSPTSAASEMTLKSPGLSVSQLSPTHGRLMLGRHSSGDGLTQVKKTAKEAVSRQKEVEKSILEKVIEEYQSELKQQQVATSQHKTSLQVHSQSQGALARTSWQHASPASLGAPSPRVSAFSPPGVKPVQQMSVPGYQNVTAAASYGLSLLDVQSRQQSQDVQSRQQSQDVRPVLHLSSPQSAHSALSPSSLPGLTLHSSHSQPAPAHSALPTTQISGMSALPTTQISGLSPPISSPHHFLPQSVPTTSALYGRTLPDSSRSPNRY